MPIDISSNQKQPKNEGKVLFLPTMENYQEEVVTVDLSFPEAKKRINSLVRSKAQKPILAIKAINKAEMLEAIKLGASASTTSEVSLEETRLIYESLKQKCILIDSVRIENPHFLVLPQSQIADKLKQWQYLITIEILNYWRAEPFPFVITIDSLLNELKVSNWLMYLGKEQGKISLTKELERLIESLSKDNKFTDNYHNFEYIDEFITTWYYGSYFDSNIPCRGRIELISKNITKLVISKIKKLMNLWSKAGSYTLSSWLEEVVLNLQKQKLDFEQQKQEASEKLESILAATEKLSNKLERERNQDDFKYAIRALKFQYKEIINIEILSQASLITMKLIEQLENFKTQVTATDFLIYDWQEKLQIHCHQNKNSYSQLQLPWTKEKIEKLSLDSFRRELEIDLQHLFVDWAILTEKEQDIIYSKILKKSNDIALKLFLEQY